MSRFIQDIFALFCGQTLPADSFAESSFISSLIMFIFLDSFILSSHKHTVLLKKLGQTVHGTETSTERPACVSTDPVKLPPCKMLLLCVVAVAFWERPRLVGFGSEGAAPGRTDRRGICVAMQGIITYKQLISLL